MKLTHWGRKLAYFVGSYVVVMAGIAPQASGSGAHTELQRQASEILNSARARIRQGLLTEADQLLSTITSEASIADQGSAALLAGNILFERGQYARAEREYSNSLQCFQTAARPEAALAAGLDAARSNLALAHEHAQRRDELAGKADSLRLATATVLGAFVIALVVLRRWLASGDPTRRSNRA